jgi:hypothetical protein
VILVEALKTRMPIETKPVKTVFKKFQVELRLRKESD